MMPRFYTGKYLAHGQDRENVLHMHCIDDRIAKAGGLDCGDLQPAARIVDERKVAQR